MSGVCQPGAIYSRASRWRSDLIGITIEKILDSTGPSQHPVWAERVDTRIGKR